MPEPFRGNAVVSLVLLGDLLLLSVSMFVGYLKNIAVEQVEGRRHEVL